MSESKEINPPKWKAENEFPELCERLRDKLKEVVDPEIGLNVIQLGLIRDVTIEPENILIRMILTTPFCPYAGSMLEMTRKKAEEALNRTAIIDLAMETWDYSMMEEGIGGDWGLF